jgi:hypothetical protein
MSWWSSRPDRHDPVCVISQVSRFRRDGADVSIGPNQHGRTIFDVVGIPDVVIDVDDVVADAVTTRR